MINTHNLKVIKIIKLNLEQIFIKKDLKYWMY